MNYYIDRDRWIRIREHHLKSLDIALKSGYVDKQIIPIINIINSVEYYVTRSSCYGRVLLVDSESLPRKGYDNILGKYHHPINISDVEEVVNNVSKGILWMNIESTILHVASMNIEYAEKLLAIAFESGYRNSSIIAYSKRGVTIEILESNKYTIPVYSLDSGYLLIRDKLMYIIQQINNMFSRIERKKNEFITRFKKVFNIR